MSLSDFAEYDDAGWSKFMSTGNIYDYLKYKSRLNEVNNSTNKTILPDERGDFCENRGKRNSSQRG